MIKTNKKQRYRYNNNHGSSIQKFKTGELKLGQEIFCDIIECLKPHINCLSSWVHL